MHDIESKLTVVGDDGNVILYRYDDFTIAYHRDSRSMRFRKQNAGTLRLSSAIDDIPPLDIIEHIYAINL